MVWKRSWNGQEMAKKKSRRKRPENSGKRSRNGRDMFWNAKKKEMTWKRPEMPKQNEIVIFGSLKIETFWRRKSWQIRGTYLGKCEVKVLFLKIKTIAGCNWEWRAWKYSQCALASWHVVGLCFGKKCEIIGLRQLFVAVDGNGLKLTVGSENGRTGRRSLTSTRDRSCVAAQ